MKKFSIIMCEIDLAIVSTIEGEKVFGFYVRYSKANVSPIESVRISKMVAPIENLAPIIT
ncbi:hypothetical protein J2S17_002689 [Cytobacillus purgationiresistens]|uniref:Uncharacterized protein n=1 Tax=Cytobacillus purgationiresistens TaxID=863449 RepID=A0ABU0AHS4_9BACI|nr:hypothetical protein [Cytobacillus purgationiresistens]